MNWSIRYASEYRFNPAPSNSGTGVVPLHLYTKLKEHIDDTIDRLDTEVHHGQLNYNRSKIFARYVDQDAIRNHLKELRNLQQSPDTQIQIYRAVPAHIKDINSGDWVTTMKEYAESHGFMSSLENNDEEHHVLTKTVPLKNLYIRKPDPQCPNLFDPRYLTGLAYHE